MAVRTIPSYHMLNDMKMKTDCQQRSHIFAPKGGLRLQVSLYTKKVYNEYIISTYWFFVTYEFAKTISLILWLSLFHQIMQTCSRTKTRGRIARSLFEPTTFNPDQLTQAEVIGQLDNKFIACLLKEKRQVGTSNVEYLEQGGSSSCFCIGILSDTVNCRHGWV